MNNEASRSLNRRKVDGEAKNHRLSGEESGHTKAQPSAGFALQGGLVWSFLAAGALAAGRHKTTI